MTGSTSTALVIANVSSGSAWKRRTRPVSGSVSRSTLSGIALFGAAPEALRGFLVRQHQGLPLGLGRFLDELRPHGSGHVGILAARCPIGPAELFAALGG